LLELFVLLVVGQRDSILLINGYSGNANSWNPDFIEQLAENHAVITFDNKGKSLKEIADNAYKIIQNKTDVLGASMGGFIAQELALAHPESVDKPILVGTRCSGDEAVYPCSNATHTWKQTASNSITLQEHYNAVAKWDSSCDRFIFLRNFIIL
jgi:pimeloyl-ACP methyl ester carboxylesterase